MANINETMDALSAARRAAHDAGGVRDAICNPCGVCRDCEQSDLMPSSLRFEAEALEDAARNWAFAHGFRFEAGAESDSVWRTGAEARLRNAALRYAICLLAGQRETDAPPSPPEGFGRSVGSPGFLSPAGGMGFKVEMGLE